MKTMILKENIQRRIYFIRDQKVMLDKHLAALYGVETRALNQAVRRNMSRFPADFMFKLNQREVAMLVSQSVIPHQKYFGGHLPYAFTENGVAMLSSVLNSNRAIQVNIEIMRIFTNLRKMLEAHKDLIQRLNRLEKKYDSKFRQVFRIIRELIADSSVESKKVEGFRP